MVTARISSKGQIAIPKSIREQAGLKEGTELAISVENRAVMLRKVADTSWRRWRGALKGTGAIEELEQEHRREVERDEKGP
jgi:AbrB family looped-hinge helix DNA binding protein